MDPRKRRAELRARLDKIVKTARSEERDLTDEERATLDEGFETIERLDADIAREERLGAITVDEPETRAEPEVENVRAEVRAQAEERSEKVPEGAVSVRSEPLTYNRGDGSQSYLADLAAVSLSQLERDGAADRLKRHAAEMRVEMPALERRLFGPERQEIREYDPATRGFVERQINYRQETRDLTRTDGAGGEFVPPLWMVEDYVALARAGRVIADRCNRMPLPAGTDSINIPTVATGSTVAPQTQDNASVSETDITTSSVSAGVKTIAGQQDVALQLLEQSPVAYDQVIFGDLAGDHAEQTDVQVINGSNASGQVRGILQIPSIDTTAYTDATPTVPELYPKIADSLNQVATTRFRPAEVIFMHPRRWYWMASALDDSNRPFVVPAANGPQNALAVAGANVAEGFAGTILGVPVVVDANIPTDQGGGTEDVIIVTRPSELYLFEGPIRTRVLAEVLSGELTVRFQLYNYLAFLPHRRAASTSIVSGTGLAAPTF